MAEHLADDELSIGDYVLSGGELAAAVVVDAVARLLPGVVGNQDSTVNESFEEGDSGLSAMDAAGGVSRLESAGRAAGRESRRDPEMAEAGGAWKRPRGCGRICSGNKQLGDGGFRIGPARPSQTRSLRAAGAVVGH